MSAPLFALSNASTAALELGPTAYQRAPTVNSGLSEAEALKVGREFESMFLSALLQPIFDNMPENKVFGGGSGEKMFKSLQVDEYAKAMTKAGGIGIAAAIQRDMLRMQEKAHG